MTWLKFINVFFCQLFFVRLAIGIEEDGTDGALILLYWVIPFTGWFNDFKTIGQGKYLILKDYARKRI